MSGVSGPGGGESEERFSPPTEFEQFVEERRRSIDQMIWQVPGLSVAAQAFLYVVSLNPRVGDAVRVFAALIALIAAAATLQLLLKHRLHEESYSLTIDASRRARGAQPFEGLEWFKRVARENARDEEAESGRRSGYLTRWRDGTLLRRIATPSSVFIWTLTLAVFAAADTLLLAGAILDRCGVLNLFA